jgi:hypothetical protein
MAYFIGTLSYDIHTEYDGENNAPCVAFCCTVAGCSRHLAAPVASWSRSLF